VRSAKDSPRHLEQRRVVIEGPAGAAAQLVQGVAEERISVLSEPGGEPFAEKLALFSAR
jgi:hypothetical protein